MVFFDLRALADAAQLHERVARVRLVLGAHDVVVIGGGDDADLDQLRIGDEVQADQVGASFLERGEVFLDERLRVGLALGLLARRVADHFVHVGRQLAAERAELLRRGRLRPASHENSLRMLPGADLS